MCFPPSSQDREHSDVLRASPPVGTNGHANGVWACAKLGARSRVPASPPPKSLRLPALNPIFGHVRPAAALTVPPLVQLAKTK